MPNKLQIVVFTVLAFAMVGRAQTVRPDVALKGLGLVSPSDVQGTWVLSNSSNGVVIGTLTLIQDGSTISGSIKFGNRNETQLESVSVSGDAITFVIPKPQGLLKARKAIIEYKGTVDGDRMKGTFQEGSGSVAWTATRQ